MLTGATSFFLSFFCACVTTTVTILCRGLLFRRASRDGGLHTPAGEVALTGLPCHIDTGKTSAGPLLYLLGWKTRSLVAYLLILAASDLSHHEPPASTSALRKCRSDCLRIRVYRLTSIPTYRKGADSSSVYLLGAEKMRQSVTVSTRVLGLSLKIRTPSLAGGAHDN